MHPLSNYKLTFKVEGPSKLIVLDNVYMKSNELHTCNTRSLYCGKALAILRSGRTPGEVALTIEAEGLPAKTVKLKLTP